MSSSKVQFLKRSLLRDIQKHNIIITKEFLLQLLAVNHQFKSKTSSLLNEAIQEIWKDTFDSKILL